jgi:hypothetical protein
MKIDYGLVEFLGTRTSLQLEIIGLLCGLHDSKVKKFSSLDLASRIEDMQARDITGPLGSLSRETKVGGKKYIPLIIARGKEGRERIQYYRFNSEVDWKKIKQHFKFVVS